MSIFAWRALAFFSLLFLVFTVSSVVITLMVVFDIQNGTPVNDSEVTFVQVANFIYAGLLLIGFVSAIGGIPLFIHYYKSGSDNILATGLKPANSI